MSETLTKENDLFRSISQGKFRTVYAILESGQDPNIRDREHWTPLMRAIYLTRENVRSHIMRLLIKYKADVNLRDQYGRTALIHACGVIGRLDVIRRIISTSKCDVCVCDQDGNTAIIYATLKNNPSAIRILVNSSFTKDSFCIDTKNCIDETALSIAVQLGYKDCVLILMNEGSANTKYVADQMSLYKLLQDRRSLHRISTGTKLKRGNASMSSLDEVMYCLSSVKLDKIRLHSSLTLMSTLDDDTLSQSSQETKRDENDCTSFNMAEKCQQRVKECTMLHKQDRSLLERYLSFEKSDEVSEPKARSALEDTLSLNPFDFKVKRKPSVNAFSSNMSGLSGSHHSKPAAPEKKYAFEHSRHSVIGTGWDF